MNSMRGLRVDQFCSLCSEEYDSEKCIPKVLNCGHTFCLNCISELVIFIEACPTCNESVVEPISNFPTNLALIEVEDPEKTLEDLELKWKKLGEFIKEERQRFNKVFEIMKNSKETLNSCLETVNELDDLQVEDPCELYNKVKEVENKIRDVEFTLYSCYKPYFKADFSLKSIPDKEDFVNKIIVEILRGKRVYAFNSEWYNDDVFWAKLSYDDGKLFIHSATSDLPKMPSLFVPHTDLKNCLNLKNFRTFIDIAGNQLVCNTITSSPLSYNFLKFCSGEDGKSFKGLTCEIKHISDKHQDVISFKIDKLNYNADQGYDVLDSLPTKIEFNSENKLQIKMWKDKCEIIKNLELSCSEESESDGVVVASATTSAESFDHLSTEGGTCVEDCGLIILLASEQ
ncbi:hypothetical protein Anas_08628 [Armadillidium nasatum]|uniref:RING-type domain-containing protein n=1 Tax=Armadillidium nasatum TaxID=96803 RepID=A0A5N5SLE8_9CRUS|nr:hypothetical protein Anas_08628 [Armadillidium nasatum]